MSSKARLVSSKRHAVACALLALAAAAPGQRVLHTLTGVARGDQFGWSVRGAGDVDGDGRADLIVGAPFFNGPAGVDAGLGVVYSGLDGSVLHLFNGGSPHEQLGFAVDTAGDVDRDGRADLVVGAPGPGLNSTVPGRAIVYSGRDGRVLWVLNGGLAGERFGYAVGAAGDVDDDGYDDVVVGAPGPDEEATSPGSAFLYSGRTGALLRTLTGRSAHDRFGHAVAGIGDANGDGYDDVVVGAPLSDDLSPADAGIAQLFSGRNGAVMQELRGTSAGGELGWTVRAAGDVDRDGRGDFIVGARFETDRGRAHVVSGASGVVLQLHSGPTRAMWFGNAVCGPGDVDGDQHADVIVGAPIAGVTPTLPQVTPITGLLRMFSGRTGTLLYETTGVSGNMVWLGFSVSAAGDVNADGVPDLTVSSPMNDRGRGEVRVLSGQDLMLSAPSYQISAAVGGSQTLSLDAKPAYANTPYFLLGSISGTNPGLPLPGGVTVPLTPDSYLLTTATFPNTPPLAGSLGLLDGQGRATATFSVPPLPALAGLTFHHAYVVFRTGPLQFLRASNAVPLRFRP